MTSKNKAFDNKKGTNTVQPPQWTEYLCCSVCEKDFNRTDRCPISLGCGHTLCRTCLGKLEQPQCQFDQIAITCNKFDLPSNSALLQLLPGDSDKGISSHIQVSQNNAHDSSNISQNLKSYENSKACIEELALFLKPGKTSDLSRPMQRKLVSLINCQLFESEGRKRALRASRALGERTATELILLHQNPTTLSASLWAAVRARGCQFLGPAMQEEALKLIHLALEDGSELSRKVLVQIVVKNLQTQFSQASKTSIGHVVQLLYRASCFKVTKRDGESSLMRLKDEFLIYEELRKEHDSQIVQIAREGGLRIAPDQWSALLYGDQAHKSHMQSIIDRLQSGGSFQQCIGDLSLALQRSNDPGNMQSLLLHFKFLSELDTETPSWDALEKSTYSAKVCVKDLVEFTNHNHHWLWQCQDATQQTSKYKTSMCRDNKSKGICPRGQSCTFAHSEAELQHYRNRKKKSGQLPFAAAELHHKNDNVCDNAHFTHLDNTPDNERSSGVVNLSQQGQGTCQCGNAINQPFNVKQTLYYHDSTQPGCNAVLTHSVPPPANQSNANLQPSLNQSVSLSIPQQVAPVLPNSNISQQPSQMHYITRNQLVYDTKPHHYNRVSVFRNGQGSIGQEMSLSSVEVQNPNVNVQIHGTVVQPNQYVIHGQQTQLNTQPNYCQLQSSQVQPVLQEPVMPPTQPSFPAQTLPPPPPPQPPTAPQSYSCLALQNGSQMVVPTHPPPPPPPPRQNVLHQSPLVFQQSPVQVHNVPPSQPINYRPRMVMPAVTPQPPMPNLVPRLLATRPVAPNENVASPNAPVMPQVVLPIQCKEVPIVPKTVYDQYHVVVPPTLNSSVSLAELRHRKDEVINKLVKKRIVAPKVEQNLQHQVGLYCDIPVETSFSESVSEEKYQNYANEFAAVSHENAVISNFTLAETSYINRSLPQRTDNPTHKMSNGHYSLWTGTTCIPSLQGLSWQNEVQEERCVGIDVVSDLDCTTSQVSSSLVDDNFVSKYSHSMLLRATQKISNYNSEFRPSHDDDFMSIKDQRIVSKYGPIARTVRSKTTSAIPEQVTANGSAATHPFLSDKNRNKSSFIAGDQNVSTSNLMSVRSEVEPTAVSVDSKKLPDVISNSYVYSPMEQNVHYLPEISPSLLVPSDANEDLLLAIELQQIEMGIQRIQRDSK